MFRGNIHPSQSAGKSIDPRRRISNLELTYTPGCQLYLPKSTQTSRVTSKSDYINPSICIQPSLSEVLPNWSQSSYTVPNRMLLLALLIVILQGDIMHKVNSNHPSAPWEVTMWSRSSRAGQRDTDPGPSAMDLQPDPQSQKVSSLSARLPGRAEPSNSWVRFSSIHSTTTHHQSQQT